VLLSDPRACAEQPVHSRAPAAGLRGCSGSAFVGCVALDNGAHLAL
jgi:hypothetical protein